MRRARAAGLAWPLPEGLDDDALDAVPVHQASRSPRAPRPVPDWAKVHTELRRPGVTLMLLWLEHKEDFPDGYSYTQFTVHYQAWKRGIDVVMRQGHKAGEKLFVDFPGHRSPFTTPGPGRWRTRPSCSWPPWALRTSCTPRRWCPRSSCTGSPPTCTPSKP